MVANNFFGFSRSRITIFSVFDLFPSSEVRFPGVSEKKATSVPDISAEQISRISNIKRLKISVKSKDEKKRIKLAGSGSNSGDFD